MDFAIASRNHSLLHGGMNFHKGLSIFIKNSKMNLCRGWGVSERPPFSIAINKFFPELVEPESTR